jgi:CRP-like cAMP-binding protein
MERYMMILKSIKRMNPELEQALRANVYPVHLRKDEVLQSPGTLNNNLYFIEKGLFHYFGYQQSHKMTLAFRWEDQFIITLKEVYGDKTGPCDGIEALEDSTVWCIAGDLSEELIEKYPRFCFQFREILDRELVAVRNVYRCSHPAGGLENLKNLRSRFPLLAHRVPLHYLANLTSIPEKKLKHLLDSRIELHTDLKRRRRGRH